MLSSHAVVLGGGVVGVRAARRLAEAGITVTLLESTPFLGGDVPPVRASWMPFVPELLDSVRDPRISVVTQAVMLDLTRQGRRFRLLVGQDPRYVDPARCTGCGECELVCPVDGVGEGGGRAHRAIYREPAGRAVPNVYAIAKRGVAPCTGSCPGGIHVQGYVALIAQGKFRQAHDLVARAIPLPGTCGRVCFHPCEVQCSRCELEEPLAVRALKRFVADRAASEDGLHWEPASPDPSLPPVAVVGSGPAGLSAAWELARQGVRVTIFEALPVAGGMMAVGIPAYRLPREVLRREIAAIEELGVEIRLNTPLGPDMTLDDLFAQGYGAVLLGLGAHRSRPLDIPGEELTGVVHAIDLLRLVCLAQEDGCQDLCAHLGRVHGIEVGRRPVVIGGGNSAIDAARTLLRMGAEEVRILYRRSRQEMPAAAEEVSAAEEEGVILETLVAPLQVVGQDGRVAAVECRYMTLGEPDESGRRRPIPIPQSEFVLETDMVVLAIGQEADLSCLPDLCDERGRLCVDEASGQTLRPGVFAAGDVIRPASVIEAIGAGKRAAAAILCYLRGVEEVPALPERPVARWSAAELEERAHQARQQPSVLPPRRRTRDFAEVERAFTAEQAVAEARRCLACGICSECLECVAVCEPGAIDHLAQPCRFESEADAVLLTGGYDLPDLEGIYRLDGGDPERVVAALLSTLEGRDRPVVARGRAAEWPAAARLGVFLCRCGGQIAEGLDLDALQGRVSSLPGVVRVEQVEFACLPEGIAALRRAAAELDGAVLVACSCCSVAQVCYSCTTQRVRCRDGLGVWDDGEESILPPWAWEYVNLREHCAWVRAPDEALEAAADLVAAAAARLMVAPAVPLVATVDAARCRTCGTCQDVCQAGAVRLEADETGKLRVLVEEGRCLACGTCAAHCPTGALVAGRVGDRHLEVTVEALLGQGEDRRVVVFTCGWGGHSGAEVAGMDHRALPAGVRVVRVPCLGRLSPGLLLRTLELGAAGVLLLGCPEDGCRYEFGRQLAAESLAQAQGLARLLGLGAECLALVGVGAGDGAAFVREVEEFADRVRGVRSREVGYGAGSNAG